MHYAFNSQGLIPYLVIRQLKKKKKKNLWQIQVGSLEPYNLSQREKRTTYKNTLLKLGLKHSSVLVKIVEQSDAEIPSRENFL